MLELYEKIKEIEKIIDMKSIDLSMLYKVTIKDLKANDIIIFDYSFGKNVFSLGFICNESGFMELRCPSTAWRCHLNDNIPLYKFKISLQSL